MSYEDDEQVVQRAINKNRSLQTQIKHAVRNKSYENIWNIVSRLLLAAGRQLTYVNEIVQKVYRWFDNFTSY